MCSSGHNGHKFLSAFKFCVEIKHGCKMFTNFINYRREYVEKKKSEQLYFDPQLNLMTFKTFLIIFHDFWKKFNSKAFQ